MKDDQHENNVVISLVMVPKHWSYIAYWERLKNVYCHATTDSLGQKSDSVKNFVWLSHIVTAAKTYVYNQPIGIRHEMTHCLTWHWCETHMFLLSLFTRIAAQMDDTCWWHFILVDWCALEPRIQEVFLKLEVVPKFIRSRSHSVACNKRILLLKSHRLSAPLDANINYVLRLFLLQCTKGTILQNTSTT